MEVAPNTVDANNPSQTGGPGITLAPPVNGTATPPAADPAPVEQPKPADTPAPQDQPKVENVPSATADDGVVTYEPTGDAGLDFSLAFIGGLGIEGTDPVMVAAANGDFSLLEAKLATLGDRARGWEKHVELGKQAFGRQLEAHKAAQAKTNEAVHAIAGGKEQWDNLVKWGASVSSPEEKEVLNMLFDASPTAAAMAARMLVSAYAESKGATVTPANPAPAASGAAPTAPKILTRADYVKEVDALYNKLGNSMDGSREYAELKSRYGLR